MFSQPTSPESSEENKSASANSSEGHELELLLADSWNLPLRKRLLDHLRDTFAPEKLPPLHLTSRPVDVGMLAGDILSLPWYRTVFTNLGDVISPETLPPLQLESWPVDVGELVGDQMSHMWWTSLLRSLADAAAPERLPALQLTSAPMDDPSLTAGSMQLPRWSSVISTPKVFLPDKPKAALAQVQPRVAAPLPKPDPAEVEFVHVLEADLKRDLRRSVFRQRLWVSLAVLEVLALIGTSVWWK
ncbi:MAG TPA: hypothetical protein VN948_04570 [Terriglobales bacterium]|nr:hypothetical protein [Terriglobales bacterium]